MNDLADFIVKMAHENTGSVSEWLKTRNKYSPIKMGLNYKRSDVKAGLTIDEALSEFTCMSMAHLGERCLSDDCVSCTVWSAQFDHYVHEKTSNKKVVDQDNKFKKGQKDKRYSNKKDEKNTKSEQTKTEEE